MMARILPHRGEQGAGLRRTRMVGFIIVSPALSLSGLPLRLYATLFLSHPFFST